jgi:hypothetical protein
VSRIVPARRISDELPALEWVQTLNKIIADCESAEIDLAVSNRASDISSRRSSGSFYTPADVADFFWNEFFEFSELNSIAAISQFLKTKTFVEPACGSGIFIFTLIRKLILSGFAFDKDAPIKLIAIDINPIAVQFVKSKLVEIRELTGLAFPNIRLVHSDFLFLHKEIEEVDVVYIGNPPFVRLSLEEFEYPNLFAEFMSLMIQRDRQGTQISLILPLSITFSRDYALLREQIKQGKWSVRSANFDNIPDFLFKFGKPGNTNTNKANSQRCSIIHLRNDQKGKAASSRLISWSKKERSKLLLSQPECIDVSSYTFDDQIPRPETKEILQYLAQAASSPVIGEFLRPKGRFSLAVATVARNYIGLRETSDEGQIISLNFQASMHRDVVFQLLSSELFYEYWKTLGDGFHVTKGLIEKFPIHLSLWLKCSEHQATAQRLWRARSKYRKSKENSGKTVVSYDFSGAIEEAWASRK